MKRSGARFEPGSLRLQAGDRGFARSGGLLHHGAVRLLGYDHTNVTAIVRRRRGLRVRLTGAGRTIARH